MESYNSLQEIEMALKKKGLERQISREELRLQYLKLTRIGSSNAITQFAMTLLKKYGVKYLIRRLTK